MQNCTHEFKTLQVNFNSSGLFFEKGFCNIQIFISNSDFGFSSLSLIFLFWFLEKV